MRCLLITGTLGSGKTTLLTAVLRENAARGLPKPVLVVNDVGRFNVDRSRLAAADATDAIIDLTSGCLDCADRDAFVAAIRTTAAERKDLVIEPTGAANGDNLEVVFAECGIQPLTATLLSVAHFGRNRAYDPKAMESQVRHAQVIGLTWLPPDCSSLQDPRLEQVLRYVGRHAPHAAVHLVAEHGPSEALIERLLGASGDINTLPVRQTCGHGCTHDHGHHHAHGHSHHLHAHVRTVALDPAVSADMLDDLCRTLAASHGLVRAKGTFGQGAAMRFDFVHGDFRTSPAHEGACEANFIAGSPIDECLLVGLVGADRVEDAITTEDAVAAIEYGLTNAWQTLMENGDLREDNAFLFRAYHRSLQFPVPEDLRRRAVLAYADWYVLTAEALQGRDWGDHPKLGQWQRRIGTHLALLGSRHGDVLGQERLTRIADLRTAHAAMAGLLAFEPRHVTRKADPVETPRDLLEVARFGREREDMDVSLAVSAFEHCGTLQDDEAWKAEWNQGLAGLRQAVTA